MAATGAEQTFRPAARPGYERFRAAAKPHPSSILTTSRPSTLTYFAENTFDSNQVNDDTLIYHKEGREAIQVNFARTKYVWSYYYQTSLDLYMHKILRAPSEPRCRCQHALKLPAIAVRLLITQLIDNHLLAEYIVTAVQEGSPKPQVQRALALSFCLPTPLRRIICAVAPPWQHQSMVVTNL